MPTKKKKRIKPTPHHVSGTRKRKLVADSRLLYLELWPELTREGACLAHALTLQALAAKRFGLRLVLQAGTAFWPRIREDEDDGSRPTRFGFKWNGLGDGVTKAMLGLGRLPEIHCWLGDPESNDLIDPTTGAWPLLAAEHGLKWTAKRPPEFLWCELEGFEAKQAEKPQPFRVVYHVQREATIVALDLAERLILPKVAEALGVQAIRTK